MLLPSNQNTEQLHHPPEFLYVVPALQPLLSLPSPSDHNMCPVALILRSLH